ncbi:cyclin-dependent kinase-like 4 [Colletotrichum asianum]|uniref:Cyclin-dependent kinase-like 4 n=1 Tax=Colletotrichum asianum TaxID=702518 RepID=A0A8H3WFX5_9PEZI|nr:cyclin-dependent kinase-like 4 [Colletotrichum asianum]
MGPGWNISRLKEHIYRRHCLSEHRHVCQRCQADFGSQSELAYHQQRAVCSELSEPLSGKIGKLKKGWVHERRTNMPDAKKWTTIYRILFDCDPVVDSPSDTQSSQPSQPTESPETMTSFEVFLRTKKRLDGDETTSEQVQTCLDLLQEWRAQQNAPRPMQASRDPSTISNSDFTLVDFSQLPQSEVEPLPGVGNEGVILDLSFLDELHNTFHVSDQYFLDTFSYGPSGDVLWDFS